MATPLDRLTLLETFVRICECGSITAAARELGTTQATASRQLADLERRLGTPLIARTTHNLAMTETGEAVLADARAILSGWDGLTERLQAEKEELAGPIKVVFPTALGRHSLQSAVLEFMEDHPKVSVSVSLGDGPVSQAVAGFDLLVKIGRPDDETLIVKDLAEVTRLPMLHAQMCDTKSLSIERLEKLPFAALGPFEGATVPLHGANGDTKTLRLSPTIATNDIFILRDTILRGVAWGILPTWLVAKEMAAGELICPLPNWQAPTLPISLSQPTSRRSIRRVRALAEHLTKTIRQLPNVSRET
ncbi:MAG: LysR family transcriptional regulator [Pseudomonadota bacterium]